MRNNIRSNRKIIEVSTLVMMSPLSVAAISALKRIQFSKSAVKPVYNGIQKECRSKTYL
jgi:hypothetical protein